MTHHHHDADYSRHTDEELEEAIEQADTHEPTVAREGSEEAHAAQREQREHMREELKDREER